MVQVSAFSHSQEEDHISSSIEDLKTQIDNSHSIGNQK